MSALKDLTKREFGRLTVIERAENDKNDNARWKCQCECGNIVVIQGQSLRSRRTRSCGCLSIETSKKHGMSGTPEYDIWHSMLQRCNNPNNFNYSGYGGRGITVCEKWFKFTGFFEDMGNRPDGLTIERIDNDKGYFKENCCWENCTVQSRNQRISKNNKTGVAGVFWDRSHKNYQVTIGIGNNKQTYIGRFAELKQAVKARKKAEQKYWGRIYSKEL